jgi:hypothetical protein
MHPGIFFDLHCAHSNVATMLDITSTNVQRLKRPKIKIGADFDNQADWEWYVQLEKQYAEKKAPLKRELKYQEALEIARDNDSDKQRLMAGIKQAVITIMDPACLMDSTPEIDIPSSTIRLQDEFFDFLNIVDAGFFETSSNSFIAIESGIVSKYLNSQTHLQQRQTTLIQLYSAFIDGKYSCFWIKDQLAPHLRTQEFILFWNLAISYPRQRYFDEDGGCTGLMVELFDQIKQTTNSLLGAFNGHCAVEMPLLEKNPIHVVSSPIKEPFYFMSDLAAGHARYLLETSKASTFQESIWELKIYFKAIVYNGELI